MSPLLARSGLSLLLRVSPALAVRAPRAALSGIGMRVLPVAAPVLTLPAVSSRVGILRMLSGGPDRTVVDTCKAKITAALEPKEIEVQGAFDDPNGSHITIFCVSEAFEGKRSLARQQMVFKAIWDEMQGPVHAVDSMTLKAPSEVE